MDVFLSSVPLMTRLCFLATRIRTCNHVPDPQTFLTLHLHSQVFKLSSTFEFMVFSSCHSYESHSAIMSSSSSRQLFSVKNSCTESWCTEWKSWLFIQELVKTNCNYREAVGTHDDDCRMCELVLYLLTSCRSVHLASLWNAPDRHHRVKVG